VIVETAGEREQRRHRRTLFDRIADRYDATRQGYPDEIVDLLVATAGLRAGSTVLEIGCGTGQLTEHLVRRGLAVTAIDIGPSMVAAARRRLGAAGVAGHRVRFEVVAFEDFAAPDAAAAFDLVVSATAFHWLDPEVRFERSARLLRPGGWLALLYTGERYDDPLGAALRDMWIARSDDGGTWARRSKPSDAEVIAATGLFGPPVERTHEERTTLAADVVVGVENTRATSLSWTPGDRARFTAELQDHLGGRPDVTLTHWTSLTMAPVVHGA
jgi:ubiquinone/menaquinone biosynthesis C-methylase UbiE